MIRLFTGKPGHGKSNHAVSVALREIRAGRAVYVSNVNGMRIPGAIPFEDPRQWQELPPGALLIVDEAQRFWRATRAGTVPPEVYAMETHRHLGIDFLLITQDPTYLLRHLRGLVGEHVHHVRRSKGVVQTFTWANRCSEDPESVSEQEIAEQGLYTLDAEAFQYYDSTELDTHKPKIPRKVWFIGGAAALLMFAVGGFMWIVASSPTEVQRAKGFIKNAIIGLIILVAGLLINTVVVNLVEGISTGHNDADCVRQGSGRAR